MFYEPLHSLATGKATKHGHKFGKALAYGAASLISHSVKGIWGTINNITRSIVKAIASITRDKDWLRKRQNMKNRTVKTIKEGFMHGGKFLLITLWGAAWGIFERPYVEVKNSGFVGLFKGLWQAITGIALKPPIGIYDFFYSVLEGVRNSAKYEEHVMDIRSRPPRNFGGNKLILPYDFTSAKATEIIRKTRFKITESEKINFLDLIEITSRNRWLKKRLVYIILTDTKFFYCKKESSDGFKLKLFKIKSVKYIKEKNSLCFQLNIPLSKKMRDQCLLKYESYERVKPLLEEFSRLQLETDFKGGSMRDDYNEIDKKMGINNLRSLKSEEKPLTTNEEAKVDFEKEIIS